MAALDLQEQEQVDALKAWWKDNGKGVMVAIGLVVGGFAATQLWHSYQHGQASAAANLYGDVLKQVSSKDAKRVGDAAAAVADKYASTAYAPRAQLLAAQASLDAADVAHAKAQLQWVIDHASEEGLQSLARLKLASVLLDEKNFVEAQKLADANHPESFDGLFADLKGDILNAQGKSAEALTAYQTAYKRTDVKSQYRGVVEMKISALGGNVAADKPKVEAAK